MDLSISYIASHVRQVAFAVVLEARAIGEGAVHVAQFATPTYCLSPVRVTPVVSEHGITDCSVALAFGAAK